MTAPYIEGDRLAGGGGSLPAPRSRYALQRLATGGPFREHRARGPRRFSHGYAYRPGQSPSPIFSPRLSPQARNPTASPHDPAEPRGDLATFSIERYDRIPAG